MINHAFQTAHNDCRSEASEVYVLQIGSLDADFLAEVRRYSSAVVLFQFTCMLHPCLVGNRTRWKLNDSTDLALFSADMG